MVPLDVIDEAPKDLLNLRSDLPVAGFVERLEDEVRREDGPLEVRQRRERAFPSGKRRLRRATSQRWPRVSPPKSAPKPRTRSLRPFTLG